MVLVGGGSRIPVIHSALTSFFEGTEITRGVNPEECVALGMQAVLKGRSVVTKFIQFWTK